MKVGNLQIESPSIPARLTGLGPRAIARETCIPKTTVENWLKSKEPAEV
jgi:hypothetical protein